jgi:zinc finger FYVE domain-containing protein 26
MECIKLLLERKEEKQANNIVQYLLSDESKIDGSIMCGKLKTAYLLAIRKGLRSKVELIRDVAKARNLVTEYNLCQKYLESTMDR